MGDEPPSSEGDDGSDLQPAPVPKQPYPFDDTSSVSLLARGLDEEDFLSD